MGKIKKSKEQKLKDAIETKDVIKIRCKKLSNGNKSIYLDYYSKDNKRQYEFLKLYLRPEKTKADKDHNKAQIEIAKTIQSQRVIDLQKSENGLKTAEDKKSNILLIDYISHVSETKSQQTKRSYDTLILFIQKFKPKTTLKQANKKFCIDFIDFLNTTQGVKKDKLSINTQVAYLRKLKVVLKRAVEDEIIPKNPLDTINRDLKPKSVAAEIPFLTIDEVKALAATETRYNEIRDAYLFSCYTGLRYSDIKGLTWECVRKVNNEIMLVYTQQKTQKLEYLPLAKPALDLLAGKERTNNNALVFDLPLNNKVNERLKRIATDAGIDGKKVTFHTARHTAATLLLSMGVSIEVVSKILGHSDIATTQIYAKVLSEQVKTGVHKLDNLF